MEGEMRVRRVPGERVVTEAKVAMGAPPMSTFTTFSPGTAEAHEQMQASAHSLRISQDTASAKSIIRSIESISSHYRSDMVVFSSDCSSLRSSIETLLQESTVVTEGIPAEVRKKLQDLVDEMRVEFVEQQQENVRLGKQIAALQRDKGTLTAQAEEHEQRVCSLESLLTVPTLTIDEPVLPKPRVD